MTRATALAGVCHVAAALCVSGSVAIVLPALVSPVAEIFPLCLFVFAKLECLLLREQPPLDAVKVPDNTRRYTLTNNRVTVLLIEARTENNDRRWF